VSHSLAALNIMFWYEMVPANPQVHTRDVRDDRILLSMSSADSSESTPYAEEYNYSSLLKSMKTKHGTRRSVGSRD